MSGSCREILPDVREWSRGLSGCTEVSSGFPGVFGRPSRMSGSCREVLPMSGSGRVALKDVRE